MTPTDDGIVPGATSTVLCATPFHSHFVDVTGGPHRDNVLCLADRGLVQGIDGVHYAPREQVSRGQMASFITRFVEECTATTLPVGGGRFVDLDGAHAHALNIHKLYTVQVTDGIGQPGRFAPLQSVTREQVASFISRALSYIDTGEARPEHQPPRTARNAFGDVRSLHAGNINALAQAEILQGYTDGTYGPTQALTRDQMASIIARAYQWALPMCHDDTPPPPPPPPPPADPTVTIVDPTGANPVSAEPGDNIEVTVEVTDVASYVIEIRRDDGQWRQIDSGGPLADGAVTLPVVLPGDLDPGDYDLRVRVTNPAGTVTEVAPDAITVALAPTFGTLTGTIEAVGSDGPTVPVTGAQVTATSAEDPSQQFTTEVDANGSCTFVDLPTGSYTITAELAGFAASETETDVFDGQTATVDQTLGSVVEGAFSVTVAGDDLAGEQLVVNTTLDDVTVSFARTDDGGPIDGHVALTITDDNGAALDWSDPAAGIFDQDTIDLLAATFGVDAPAPIYAIDGGDTLVLLDAVSLGLGPDADQIAGLTLDLIDARFLPDEVVHVRDHLALDVVGVGDQLELAVTGLADDYEQGATSTGDETVSFVYNEGRGDVTSTLNVLTVHDDTGDALEGADLDALFTDFAFVDQAGGPSDHIRPLHGTQPEAVVAPATIAVGMEFALDPAAPFGSYTLRVVAYDVTGLAAGDVSLADALSGTYRVLDAAEDELRIIESHDIQVNILDVGGDPFTTPLQAFLGRSVDLAVRIENHNVQRTLDEGWFLALEVGGFLDAQSLMLEACERATTPVAVVTDCDDVSGALTPIVLTDGRWLLQIGALPEPDGIGPGEQRWHHFRITFNERGAFTSELFLFEGV